MEFLLISEAVPFLVVALATIIPVVVVVLVREIELLPPEAVGDEVSGVTALEAFTT
jgi:hypothetical protein